jgi:hypothetical protein
MVAKGKAKEPFILDKRKGEAFCYAKYRLFRLRWIIISCTDVIVIFNRFVSVALVKCVYISCVAC